MRIGLIGPQDISKRLRLAGHEVERFGVDPGNLLSRERFERSVKRFDLFVAAYPVKPKAYLVAGIAKGLGKKLAILTRLPSDVMAYKWAPDWSGTDLDELLGWIRMTELALINAKIDWLATRLGGDNTKQQVVERRDDE